MSKHTPKTLYHFQEYYPQVDATAFLAPGAKIIGQVTIGAYASIWYNTVLRGDIERIKIGNHTNVQDNSTIHVADDLSAILGDYVTVGHGVILHGCAIANNCLIGMGAIILNYAEIGENTIVAAGTLRPQGKKIPPNSLVMGSPGKVIRQLTAAEIESNLAMAHKYVRVAKAHRET
ncbi:MAG: gamma carbonic anhydrase family protein, partial [Sporomusaceae bacterium]|nr:gamma carbonic anhydrase family protein [Sporomusaceae bacterium]